MIGTDKAGAIPVEAEKALKDAEGARAGLFAFIQQIVDWIPTEALAIYVPGVAVIAASTDPPEPSLLFLIIMAIAVPVFLLLRVWEFQETIDSTTFVDAGLALLAFLLWSLTIPLSGWYEIDKVADNSGAWIPIVGGVLGVVIGRIGRGIQNRRAQT